MELVVERVAGLDIHRDAVVACVRLPKPKGRARISETREYPTTTTGLERLVAWLAEVGVTYVAMEATGCTGSRCSRCSRANSRWPW